MAKSNLTDEQKSIIKRLTDEFEKINYEKPSPMGLIDVNEIIENTRLEKQFNNECELANKAFSKFKRDEMAKDMESIKGDLEKLNLGARILGQFSESFIIFPTHKPYDNLDYYQKVTIEYKDSHHYTRTYKGIQRNISTKYSVGTNHSQICYASAQTFAEFIKSDVFKEKLTYLYKQTLK